ncbi:MAG: Lpg1974 family pore-forming outer membrane protein [Gemmataceae bacterium]|nr:Lpg1974 family pore-forming outer membrane protein [Gemmataceae bacterium]MCI0737926.1 Lpg1974 family pore-forming outer membrane protein [Gemmataceae bacterium]
MRKHCSWLVLVLALFVAPQAARAQYYEVPPVIFTGPLSHPRYEEGGFYTALEFLWWQQYRPIRSQRVAVRGLIDFDGSIDGSGPGQFVGSGAEALNTNQLEGPHTYQPGFNLTFGWRFESGTSVFFEWTHLWESRYAASASLAPPLLQAGAQGADSFLFSPVFNFPIEFSGNPRNVAVGNLGATFGIWNAASNMSIQFQQRFDKYDLGARIPIWQTDSFRNYGLIGAHIVGLWERFRWRTADLDEFGQGNPLTTGVYSNIVSNRLYGVHMGCGNEWYLGSTPIGAFSVSLDVEASLSADFVKARARYETEARSASATRSRNLYAFVPGAEGKLSFWWYPWEGIQVQLGYSGQIYLNTIGSRYPIDFNYGTLDPEWQHVSRWLHGLNFGVGFIF